MFPVLFAPPSLFTKKQVREEATALLNAFFCLAQNSLNKTSAVSVLSPLFRNCFTRPSVVFLAVNHFLIAMACRISTTLRFRLDCLTHCTAIDMSASVNPLSSLVVIHSSFGISTGKGSGVSPT